MNYLKREELNYFNAICCLLVILIHILSYAVSKFDNHSWQWSVIYFPWKTAFFVVPGFLLCGAVKLSLQISSGNAPSYFVYLKSRILKVYVPYIIATLAIFLVYSLFGMTDFDPKRIPEYILLGNISPHLYYIVVTMQFYLLYPLWKLVVRKIPPYLGIPGSAVISMLFLEAPNAFGQFDITVKYTDRMFGTYLFYWIIGLYIGMNYDRFRESIKKNRNAVLVSLPIVFLYIYITYIQNVNNVILYQTGYIKIFVDILSIFVLFLLCISITDSKRECLKSQLQRIQNASFYIYLYHCMLIEIVIMVIRNIS